MSVSIKSSYGPGIMIFKEEVDSQYVAQRLAKHKDFMKDDAPFAIVNLQKLVHLFNEFRAHLPRVKPYYAVKCNNDLVILKTLAQLGCGFDCASKAEIEQVIQFVPATNIIYANPCKAINYLKYANTIGVNLMTFDNKEELYKIKEHHSAPKLILRIFANDPSAQLSLGKKFGCDPIHDAPYLLKLSRVIGLSCVGISFHVGSGCNDPNSVCNAIKEAKQLFKIGKDIGHEMAVLDIGGGFPGNDSMGKTTFRKMAEHIQPILDEYFPASDRVEIIAEPGRYFAASAVSIAVNIISATKVHASRITENTEDANKDAFMYYVNDGCFGSFNCILTDNYFPKGCPLYDTNNELPPKEFLSCVWGPTCDGQDRIEVKPMRKMNVGEWLYYSNMGAYTKSTASHFNGFRPAKYFYFTDEATWEFIRGQKCSASQILTILK